MFWLSAHASHQKAGQSKRIVTLEGANVTNKNLVPDLRVDARRPNLRSIGAGRSNMRQPEARRSS